MSYTVTKYPQGTFSWADVSTHNPESTIKFMNDLMGWQSETMPTDQPGMDYTMFFVDGKTVAGATPMPPGMETVPSMWKNYVTVDDVDTMSANAVKLGATLIMPPTEAMDVGRFCALQDPEGASLFLWQPKKHIGAGLINTVGAMSWNEGYFKDLNKAKSFYGSLFGWTFEPMPGNESYLVIKNNGRMNGGMMTITDEMMGMPPKWMVYFTVANTDQSVEKVKALGGQVYMTKDIAQGKIAAVADPAGASFFLIQLTNQPTEWIE